MVFITAFFFSHHATLCLILQWQKGPVYFEDIYVNILFACEMRNTALLLISRVLNSSIPLFQPRFQNKAI